MIHVSIIFVVAAVNDEPWKDFDVQVFV